MSKSIVAQTGSVDNLSPALRQAVEAAKVLQPRVNGRYEAAIELLALGAVRVNEDGSVDVASRSGGPLHHLNGRSCDCKDATFNAPMIANRKACAHQVAAWMALKGLKIEDSRLQMAEPDQTSKSCWVCGSKDLSQGDRRGQAGRCRVCGSRLAGNDAPTTATPAASAATPGTLTLAQLTLAAAKVNGVAYSLQPTHIGGHGYAQLLQAEEDADGHETYLICGDWQEDALFVARWGAAWGQVDAEAMATLGAALRPAPAQVVTVLGEAVTLPAGRAVAGPRPVRAELAYYIESSPSGAKLMVTTGSRLPRCLASFEGDDRLERARASAAARAAAQADGMRRATPGATVDVRQAPLPAAWRERMGGFQVGQAWVVYAGK